MWYYWIALTEAKVQWNSGEYIMAFLQSDRLYFLRYAIEIQTDRCSSLKVNRSSLRLNSPRCNTRYNRLDVMVVPDWSVALQAYCPPSEMPIFSTVKPWPLRMSLFGSRGFSVKTPNPWLCNRDTEAVGSSVVQLKSILKPKYAVAYASSLPMNFKPPLPEVPVV